MAVLSFKDLINQDDTISSILVLRDQRSFEAAKWVKIKKSICQSTDAFLFTEFF